MFDYRVEAGKKGLTSQILICYQCQGANVIILLLPGSPLSILSKVQTFLAWHLKAFYDLSGTFFCFLYLPYHKSIVSLHVLSSSIALLIMFHLLEILFIYFLSLSIQLQLIFPSPMKLSLIPLRQK